MDCCTPSHLLAASPAEAQPLILEKLCSPSTSLSVKLLKFFPLSLSVSLYKFSPGKFLSDSCVSLASIKAKFGSGTLSKRVRMSLPIEAAASQTETPEPQTNSSMLLLSALDLGMSGVPDGEYTSLFFPDFLREFNAHGESQRKLCVVGHRGCGKNKKLVHGEIPDARASVRENTITSFNLATHNGADFVEFDVQVTKDGHPVIFHDDYIITDDKIPRKIGDITVEEFFGMGPQRDSEKKVGKPLYREAVDGSLGLWTVTLEDSLCTLQEAFENVHPVGFNIEVKFDDHDVSSDLELRRVITPIIENVRHHANGRKIYFSSFHPDAVSILRKEQSMYPVFFLTDGGVHTYKDERRNSIQSAIEVCQQGNLQGIVTEVRAVLQDSSLVKLVKNAGLWLFTYGELNNVAEALHKQEQDGVDGVIVDHVLEMVTVARHLQQPDAPSSGPVGVEAPLPPHWLPHWQCLEPTTIV